MITLTPSRISNAVKVLRSPADGTRANRTERIKAACILNTYASELDKFADKNSTSRVAPVIREQAIKYRQLASVIYTV